jgi:hypothetical protein
MMTDPIQLAAERIRFQEKNVRLRSVIVQLLEAPYLGGAMPAIARTNACLETDHTVKRPDGVCICGLKKP